MAAEKISETVEAFPTTSIGISVQLPTTEYTPGPASVLPWFIEVASEKLAAKKRARPHPVG